LTTTEEGLEGATFLALGLTPTRTPNHEAAISSTVGVIPEDRLRCRWSDPEGRKGELVGMGLTARLEASRERDLVDAV